jgi:hypothetical protein
MLKHGEELGYIVKLPEGNWTWLNSSFYF